MPRTEAGKRLLEQNLYGRAPGEEDYYYTVDIEPAIDAIEDEAREHQNNEDFRFWKQRIRAAERARIRAAMEGLNPQQDGDIVTLNGTRRRPVTPADYVELYRAAVLAIIDNGG